VIKVEAANNEDMWIDETRVGLVGPLMDRGLRQLGRAVLYMEGFPPLPVKETVDELATRVANNVRYPNVVEDSSGADSANQPASEGPRSRLVV
jgi:hypothetical protein